MNTYASLRQSLRMLPRDWHSGDLRLLALALVVAVAAISSVGFFVDRLRVGLHRDAAQYLGGDAVVESDHPVDAQWDPVARRLGLRLAQSVSFPSMAMATHAAISGPTGLPGASSAAPAASAMDTPAASSAVAGPSRPATAPGPADAPAPTVLVAVKAVTPGYPLRGALQVRDGNGSRIVAGGPAPGTAWVDPPLLAALGVEVGAALRLGKATLRIAEVLSAEPDRSLQVLGFAPRVLISSVDLPATGLVQPASRITYRWMVAGDRQAVDALVAQVRPQLARGERLETLDDGRPEMQRTLARADRFLGLVALLTALIAAVAVNSAARRYAVRRLDSCALMRCLGLTQGQIARLFAFEFLFVGVLASLVGVAAGLGLHTVLLRSLAGFLPDPVPPPSVLPAVQGVLIGLVLLLGFALPPVEQLRRVAPLRVLRRDVGDPTIPTVLSYGLGAAGFALLLLWVAADVKLGAVVGAGFLGCIGLFALAARGVLLALDAVRRRTAGAAAGAWRQALAALQRRPGTSIAQLVALAIGLMALLLLAIVRTDLVDQWRGQVPPGAPNRFVINIQPEQAQAVRARLARAGIADAELEPMIRGRLVSIDGRTVGPDSYGDERTRALVEREFNLSYRDSAPPHNTLVAGTWFAPDAPELSMEEGIAQRLGVVPGQRLGFDIAGQVIEARVTSIRKLNWDSMRVNFFVIMAPVLLRDAPQSLITAFHLGPEQAGLASALVREFPNLTVIDTDEVLGQVRGMLDQVIGAAQFLFAFALAAGVLVLMTALSATQDERVREAALLRALGATRQRLARANNAELLLIGAVAGALASAGAVAIAAALAHTVFDFAFRPHAWVPLAGLAGGTVAAWLGGRSGMQRILATPPMRSLRDA